MKKSKSTEGVVGTKTTLVEALSKLPHSEQWFKLNQQEKEAFEKARSGEEQAKKAGFILGGSLKQVL